MALLTPNMERWVLASRPPTLWAAVAPVLVGGSLAWSDGVFRLDVFVVVLIAAVLIQIGVNFANDLSDALSGADNADRIGPQRAVSSGLITAHDMKRGIGVVFGLAIVCGVYLILIAGWVIAVIGVASIIAAFAYTGGPFPYGYHALGEVFVFVFFGLVATSGTRYVFDRTFTAAAWVGGVSMGCLATAILLANNIRDIETDAASGKRTLAVRLGRDRSRNLFTVVVVAAFVVITVGVVAGTLPTWTLLVLLATPLAAPIVRTINTPSSGPSLIGALKGTARLQITAGALFAIGVLVS